MTPKEKAIKLYNRYMDMQYPTHSDRAKQCALIAVDEIQNTKSVYVNDVEYDYYEEVKKEIEKL